MDFDFLFLAEVVTCDFIVWFCGPVRVAAQLQVRPAASIIHQMYLQLCRHCQGRLGRTPKERQAPEHGSVTD